MSQLDRRKWRKLDDAEQERVEQRNLRHLGTDYKAGYRYAVVQTPIDPDVLCRVGEALDRLDAIEQRIAAIE